MNCYIDDTECSRFLLTNGTEGRIRPSFLAGKIFGPFAFKYNSAENLYELIPGVLPPHRHADWYAFCATFKMPVPASAPPHRRFMMPEFQTMDMSSDLDRSLIMGVMRGLCNPLYPKRKVSDSSTASTEPSLYSVASSNSDAATSVVSSTHVREVKAAPVVVLAPAEDKGPVKTRNVVRQRITSSLRKLRLIR